MLHVFAGGLLYSRPVGLARKDYKGLGGDQIRRLKCVVIPGVGIVPIPRGKGEQGTNQYDRAWNAEFA